jgi:hypothetical protein
MSCPHDPGSAHPNPPAPDADPELLDDGQEEVFSRSAVEAGDVADPKALGPEDLARAPKSPGPIRSA